MPGKVLNKFMSSFVNFIKNNLRMNKKKIVFYTAIFGDYDDLKDPPKSFLRECDFICFTNNKKIKSKYYKIIYSKNNELSDHMQSRSFKILPHKYLAKDYQYSIWIDASVMLKEFNVANMIKFYVNKCSWVSFIHPERNCIYDEALVCIKLKKDNGDSVLKQMSRYKLDGYPSKNGLTANGFILREHNNPAVIEVCEYWWNEIVSGSKRDQLSFCYVAWKKGLKFVTIDKNIWDNDYFKVLKHRHDAIEK